MKLASIKTPTSRDGVLVVVSQDLSRYAVVSDIAPTLQYALEHWSRCEPLLQAASAALNADTNSGEAFSAQHAAAPLPRAYQWCDGSAYLSHAELVRKARGAEMPAMLYHEPLLYQGGSDDLSGPHDPIYIAADDWGLDLEAEIAVITDDVPMGVSVEQAHAHIKLVTLVNDVSLRLIMKPELTKGFGFYQSKPSTAFAPVAVTPDELADLWHNSALDASVVSHVNGQKLGEPNAATDLNFNFAQIIAHATKTRNLKAGTIIGSGTVSNRNPEQVGSSCLQEIRMLETIATGEAITPFMTYGDVVRIEALDANGDSIFGAIEQKVEAYAPA